MQEITKESTRNALLFSSDQRILSTLFYIYFLLARSLLTLIKPTGRSMISGAPILPEHFSSIFAHNYVLFLDSRASSIIANLKTCGNQQMLV